MAFLYLFALLAVAINADSCPTGTCPSTETCCSLGNGQFGCCPYPQADCCTDHSHCCPNGYTCDLSKGQCVHGTKNFLVLNLAKVSQPEDSCPTGTCPSTETCCSLGNGQFGCCPYPQADCCTDHSHCCPNGYTCDLSKGQCIQGEKGMLLTRVAVPEDSCPTGTCPSTETCCSLGNGQFGCCPYPQADCCTDHSHCCPSGYTCDLSKGQCIQGEKSFVIVHLANIARPQDSCPTGTCPSTETCCSLGNGQFGCCPYPQADCCTDHSHCCPSGYTCDLSKGQCIQGTATLAIARLAFVEPEDSCPTGTCPSTETCCSLGNGQFGCCPYPQADCCTDHSHCCPNGYTCDLSKGQCIQGTRSFVLTELAAVTEPEDSCPTGTCPSTETCCSLGNGQFGCCPYPQADCCTDHSHCCPSGYTCDLSKGQCIQGTKSFVLTRVAAVVAPEDSCPTGTCPSSETCCSLGNGQFGCCPYPQADCCTDHSHCCPNGYTCDLSKGQCIQGTKNFVLTRLAGL